MSDPAYNQQFAKNHNWRLFGFLPQTCKHKHLYNTHVHATNYLQPSHTRHNSVRDIYQVTQVTMITLTAIATTATFFICSLSLEFVSAKLFTKK